MSMILGYENCASCSFYRLQFLCWCSVFPFKKGEIWWYDFNDLVTCVQVLLKWHKGVLHATFCYVHRSSHFTEAYAKSFKGILSPILFDHFGLCFASVSVYSPIFSVLLLNKVICRWYPLTFLCRFPVQWHLALPSLFHWQLMPAYYSCSAVVLRGHLHVLSWILYHMKGEHLFPITEAGPKCPTKFIFTTVRLLAILN